MFDDYPDILTPEDVSEMLRLGRNGVYECLTAGRISGFRNGRVWRIPKQAVIDFAMRPYIPPIRR